MAPPAASVTAPGGGSAAAKATARGAGASLRGIARRYHSHGPAAASYAIDQPDTPHSAPHKLKEMQPGVATQRAAHAAAPPATVTGGRRSAFAAYVLGVGGRNWSSCARAAAAAQSAPRPTRSI